MFVFVPGSFLIEIISEFYVGVFSFDYQLLNSKVDGSCRKLVVLERAIGTTSMANSGIILLDFIIHSLPLISSVLPLAFLVPCSMRVQVG